MSIELLVHQIIETVFEFTDKNLFEIDEEFHNPLLHRFECALRRVNHLREVKMSYSNLNQALSLLEKMQRVESVARDRGYEWRLLFISGQSLEALG